MKVLIVYFSGTGNTKVIAKGYKAALELGNHHVEIMSIEASKVIPEHDVLIIGGPIYAGNMPDEVINWVRKNIQHVESSKKAIVFSTSAGLLNANGVKSIGKKVIKRGYTLVDTTTFEMPRNFYIDKYDPTPEAIQEQQFEAAAGKILLSISRLRSTEQLTVKESVVTIDLFADIFRIMAKSLGKSFQINENCMGCGLCEKSCPKNNIDHTTKTYSNKCIMCTRCIHSCPVNAISYKGKTIEQYKVHYDIKIS
jgi:ferredoxin/flavodoxin